MAGRIKMFDIKFLCGESTVLPMAVGALDAYNVCKEYIANCNMEKVVKDDCLAELYNNFEDYSFDSEITEFGVDGIVMAVESKVDMPVDFFCRI